MKFNPEPIEQPEETLEETVIAEEPLFEPAQAVPEETAPEPIQIADPAVYKTQTDSYSYSSPRELSAPIEENPGYEKESIEDKKPIMDRVLDPAQEIYEIMCELTTQVKIPSLLKRKSTKHFA